MKILILGGTLLLCSFYLAFIAHSTIWYSPFVIGGFLFFDGMNSPRKFSALKHKRDFLKVWLIFIAITIVIEIVGKWWLHLWEYPTFNTLDYVLHVILIGYSFTFFFGLEVFVWLQGVFPSKKLQMLFLPIAAFVFGYINEYPNLFAHEWRYLNWPLGRIFGIPILASILWMFLLISLAFKKPFINRKISQIEAPQN